jgi:iron complex outermembrane receptor protein
LRTRGIEVDLGRIFPDHGSLRVQYTYLRSDAGVVPFESKYVLDYPRHAFAVVGNTSLPLKLGVGGRLDYRYRLDGRRYWLLEARVLKQLRNLRVFFEASNLLNTEYQEIKNVNMPGRWFQAGIEFDFGRGKQLAPALPSTRPTTDLPAH